jgi:Tol biopolymer transport system component
LWLRQISANSTNRLTPPMNGGFWGFAFAPDNSYVYYIFNNKDEPQKSGLYKIPLLGGEPQRIRENVSSIAISPDGKRIALVRINDKTNIFTINPDGDDERTVAALPADLRLWGMSWTPDGTALLCTIRQTVADKSLYYVSEISPENGTETIVLPAQEKIIFGAIWLPDKSAMLLTMREPNADIRQIWQYLPASGDWRRVTNDDNSYKIINLTRDGKTIVSNQFSRLAAIWVTDGLPLGKRTAEKKSLLNNSDNFRQITDGVNNFDRLGWLADNRLVYSTTEDSREMIFTINADGTNPRQITGGEDGIWIFPNVTGSGRSISFLSSRTGFKQVWRVDGDGKNLTKMTQTGSSVFAARILRDNATVIYTTQQATGVFLFKQTADGQTAQLTESHTSSFAVSADETLLAVETLDENTGKYRVELRSLTDGQRLKIFDFVPNRQMTFTPDGKNLAYDALHEGLNQIMIQPLDGGEPYALTNFQTDDIFSFDWSPDGNHLAVIRGKQLNDAVLIKTVNH